MKLFAPIAAALVLTVAHPLPGSAKTPEAPERDSAAPATLEEMRAAIEEIWAGRELRRGTTAIVIADAITGEELYAVHPDESLNPASNVKLISTAAALDFLGPGYRHETRLFGNAPGLDGTVRGSVYLLGSYDPSFGTNALTELAEGLVNRGVRRIAGDVVLSNDLHRDTVNSGRVRIRVQSTDPGEVAEVSVSPMSEFIEVQVTAKTRKRGRNRVRATARAVETDDGPRLRVEVRGFIRQGRAMTLRRSVGLRSTFTGYSLRAALRNAGVAVDGSVRIEPFPQYAGSEASAGRIPLVLTERQSPPLSYFASRINKRSINWLADRVIMNAGAVRFGGEPTMAKGVDLMKEWLVRAGVDPDAVVLDTGSGLSYKTELTARQIMKVLRAAAGYTMQVPYAGPYRESLSVGGEDGTLRRRFRGTPLQANVIGKTGTLTRVIALSGFFELASGRPLCFSIVTNGHRHHRRQRVRSEHEKIVRAAFASLGGSNLERLIAPEPAPAEPESTEAIASTDAADADLSETDELDSDESLMEDEEDLLEDVIEVGDETAEEGGKL